LATEVQKEIMRKAELEVSKKEKNSSVTLKRGKDEVSGPKRGGPTIEPAAKKVKPMPSVPSKAISNSTKTNSMGGMDIFQKLNQSVALPKVKIDLALKRKSSDPIPQSQTLSQKRRSHSDVSPLDALITPENSAISYRKVSSPVKELVPTISEKTGKLKKSVRFKPEKEINQVVFFSKEDAPVVVVSFS
jgi:hypothetical protein